MGEGWGSLFPETFSFHAARHDPAELYLQLEDLRTNPGRLGSLATRRDSDYLVRRLLLAIPSYLNAVLDRLELDANAARSLPRACEDVAVFCLVLDRFLTETGLSEDTSLRLAGFSLRKTLFRALEVLVEHRVRPQALTAYVTGTLSPSSAQDEANEVGLFYALAGEDEEARDRIVLAAAERAYHSWVEHVCLDESNQAFEIEDSPFEDRETEVRRAIFHGKERRAVRGRDLCPFLRRPQNRDCERLLRKLETWFLRRYDVHHAAMALYHADNQKRGVGDADQVLSYHTTANYFLGLAVASLPFLIAVFAYQRFKPALDAVISGSVAIAYGVALWFLLYRFFWRKDLTFFHAWVPRMFAGIIVGYLPVFLIDEVWDLASRSPLVLAAVVTLLGSTTLLYIYVEVHGKLGDPQEAFSRARALFLIGILQAAGMGVIVTSLLGPLMVVRNWAPPGFEGSVLTLAQVLPPVAGELPMIIGGSTYLLVFPSALFLMTFLSFFIGTFLQLLWEDFPITEPL